MAVPVLGWFAQSPDPVRAPAELVHRQSAQPELPQPVVVPDFGWFVQASDGLGTRPAYQIAHLVQTFTIPQDIEGLGDVAFVATDWPFLAQFNPDDYPEISRRIVLGSKPTLSHAIFSRPSHDLLTF